jgi:hypothetical protein
MPEAFNTFSVVASGKALIIGHSAPWLRARFQRRVLIGAGMNGSNASALERPGEGRALFGVLAFIHGAVPLRTWRGSRRISPMTADTALD